MSISLMIIAATLAAQDTSAPAEPVHTIQDSHREIRESEAARRAADRNGDGEVDDMEFRRYHRQRLRMKGADGDTGSGPRRGFGGLGGHDLNNDGALTPYELYPEADYTLPPRD